MATVSDKQEFTFQAEIKQLLHLLTHSLYQSREIALRELISNASDALDKMRYVALTDERFRESGPLEIALEGQPEARQLIIRDNGIGMTRDELVANLGTIARSGSLEFLKNLAGQPKADLSLIGQFGVGFYAAFMIADTVRVRSRSYTEESGWEWESDGSGTFTVTPAEGPGRGTEVVLHLKDDAQDFADNWRVRGIIKKYSSFVPHPIRVGGELVNDQKPIWVEPRNQVTEEQHRRFFQHLTHRADESPLWYLHLAADSPIQFRAVLYCPPTNVERLGYGREEHGLHLCAKRVLVQSDCKDLLPNYLRFLHGLVDSEDLPLNVSRETLQDNTLIRRIRTSLVKGVLDRLHSMATDEPDTFLTFTRQFGAILKEAVAGGAPDRDRVVKLLRFASSRAVGPDAFASLDDYLGRAPAEQAQIYYIAGPDLATLKKSPNLEVFRRNGLEVLYLTEPIDEFVMSALGEYEGKAIASIDAADLKLPGSDSPAPAGEKPAGASGGFDRVLELFREALGGRIEAVRESKRLTESPCCLVNAEGGMSSHLQKILKRANKEFVGSKRVLEINPGSPLIRRLGSLSANRDHDRFIKQCGEQLFSNALLLEGIPEEPEALVSRVQTFMEEAAEKRSPIVF